MRSRYLASRISTQANVFESAYLEKSCGVGLLEDLDAELDEAGGFLQALRAVRELLFEDAQFVVALLLDVRDQLLFARAQRLDQVVHLRHDARLELHAILLKRECHGH